MRSHSFQNFVASSATDLLGGIGQGVLLCFAFSMSHRDHTAHFTCMLWGLIAGFAGLLFNLYWVFWGTFHSWKYCRNRSSSIISQAGRKDASQARVGKVQCMGWIRPVRNSISQHLHPMLAPRQDPSPGPRAASCPATRPAHMTSGTVGHHDSAGLGWGRTAPRYHGPVLSGSPIGLPTLQDFPGLSRN